MNKRKKERKKERKKKERDFTKSRKTKIKR